jgi:hypothetical protein
MRPKDKSLLETVGDTAIVRLQKFSSKWTGPPDEIPLKSCNAIVRELISRSHELRTLGWRR